MKFTFNYLLNFCFYNIRYSAFMPFLFSLAVISIAAVLLPADGSPKRFTTIVLITITPLTKQSFIHSQLFQTVLTHQHNRLQPKQYYYHSNRPLLSVLLARQYQLRFQFYGATTLKFVLCISLTHLNLSILILYLLCSL